MSSYIARNSISGTRLTPQNETGFLAAPGRESGQETSRQILPVVPEMASTEKPSVNLFSISALLMGGLGYLFREHRVVNSNLTAPANATSVQQVRPVQERVEIRLTSVREVWLRLRSGFPVPLPSRPWRGPGRCRRP